MIYPTLAWRNVLPSVDIFHVPYEWRLFHTLGSFAACCMHLWVYWCFRLWTGSQVTDACKVSTGGSGQGGRYKPSTCNSSAVFEASACDSKSRRHSDSPLPFCVALLRDMLTTESLVPQITHQIASESNSTNHRLSLELRASRIRLF